MPIAIPLEGALLGLAAIVIVASAVVLAPLARSFFQQLPGPLGALGVAIDNAVLRAVAAGVQWSAGSVHSFAQAIGAPFWALHNFMGNTNAALSALYAGLWALRYQTIPAAAADIAQYAHSLYLAGLGYTIAVQGWLETLARSLYVAAIGYAQQVGAAAFAQAEQLAIADARYAEQLQQQALAYTQSVGAALLRDLEQAAAADARYAEQLAQADARYAEQLTAGAEAYARALTQDAIDYTTAGLRGLAQQLERDLAQAEAYARALAIPIAAAVTAIENLPCIRFCDPLGDLGSTLQALQDAAALAVLLALLEESVGRPDQVASAIADVVVPLAHDVAGSLQLGIPA